MMDALICVFKIDINLMLLSVMNVLHLLVNQVNHNDGRISRPLWKEMPMPEPQQMKRGECDGSLTAARPLGISSLGRGSPTLSLELCDACAETAACVSKPNVDR